MLETFANCQFAQHNYFHNGWFDLTGKPEVLQTDASCINFVVRIMQLKYVFDPFLDLRNERRSRNQTKLRQVLLSVQR